MSATYTAVIVGATFKTERGTVRNTLVSDLRVGDRILAELLPNGTTAIRQVVEVHGAGLYTDALLDGSERCYNFAHPNDTRALLIGDRS